MAWTQDELGNWYDDGSGEDMSTNWNETTTDTGENIDWSGYADLTPAELGRLATITDSNLAEIARLAKSTLGGQG